MPIVETMGIALFACGIPVLLLQQFELVRLGRTPGRDSADAAEAVDPGEAHAAGRTANG